MEHCQSTRLRRKAFRDDPKLDELLQYARALEISSHQYHADEIEKQNRSSTDEAVYQFKHGRPTRPQRQSVQACYNCGGRYPHSDKPCSAAGKACRSCEKIGHFEKMCN